MLYKSELPGNASHIGVLNHIKLSASIKRYPARRENTGFPYWFKKDS